MAQVPQPRGLSVSPSTSLQPLQQLNAPALAFGGTAAGKGFSALGDAASKTSDLLNQHALQFQAINNKVAADQSAIDYAGSADKIALEYKSSNTGMAAVDNLDKVYSDLEDRRAAGATGLSPAAQVEYNASSRAQLARAQSTLRDFAVTQRKGSIVNTSEAKVGLAQADAAADPSLTASSVATIAQEWAYRSRPDVLGLTPEQAQLGMRHDIGAIFQGQIRTAIDAGDYPKAQGILDANRDNMTQEQLVSVAGAMKVGQNAYIAKGWADEFVSGHGTTSANPLSALQAAVPGATLTSNLRTPEHNRAVGGVPNSDHLTGQAADFVPPKGQTMAELATQLKSVGIGQVINEGTHVHVEWGKGAPKPVPAANVDPEQYIANSYASIEAQSAKDFPDNPVLREQAAQAARSRVNIQAQQIRANQTATFDRLSSAALKDNIQDPTALSTAYPGAAGDLALISATPHYAKGLESITKANAQEMTPAREGNLIALKGMQQTDPAKFAQINLAQVDLPTSERLRLGKDQVTAHAKMAKQAQTDTVTSQAMRSLAAQEAVRNLGLTTSARNKDPELNHQYFQFAGAISADIDAYTAAHGKPPVPGSKDMNSIITQVTATVGKKEGSWFFGMGGDPGHPAFQVPDTERAKITSALAARGNTNPSEKDIAAVYRMHTRGK